ncbi:MAG TPA: hypothetical protein VNH40_12885 [Gaiellaceae bacterium]|nr:hypothetical protein [Gaiellaceae bacterium]
MKVSDAGVICTQAGGCASGAGHGAVPGCVHVYVETGNTVVGEQIGTEAGGCVQLTVGRAVPG